MTEKKESSATKEEKKDHPSKQTPKHIVEHNKAWRVKQGIQEK